MTDLLLALAAVLLLSAAAFLGALRLSVRLERKAAAALGAALALLTVLFAAFLNGRLVLARLLPLPSVIVAGDAIPVGAALLAGLAAGRRRVPRWRRALFGALPALAGAYALLSPLLVRPPRARERWTADGVCLQTTPASCSACCAATLLRHHGIGSGEREMIRLCLTGASGTPQLGLYRGLALKARGSGLRVRAFHMSVDELREWKDWPVVLLVRLERGAGADPRYERQWGWTPGLGHAVVVFGFAGKDRIEVGDPSVGREQWGVESLHVLWRGEGLALVRR